MKNIALSFPYPSTSRHNLSQDVATSLSMGLVTPVRVVKVLPGDSHRISTSFSLVSNPLVKPLLQGVRMRYCRFWVPSRIYNIDQRANNSNFDPLKQPVRAGRLGGFNFPAVEVGDDSLYHANYQQSSLFDYLGLAPIESNYVSDLVVPGQPSFIGGSSPTFFNAEPYLAYVNICRDYFADSATGLIAWSGGIASPAAPTTLLNTIGVVISPLKYLDNYIDEVQNSRGLVLPYNWAADFSTPDKDSFTPFVLRSGSVSAGLPLFSHPDFFGLTDFGISHVGLCVAMNRPDRLSRLFDTRPLTSQNATVSASEVSIGNLAFLAKLQRYLTRRFFGGSRFTDIMYSVFGQRVPHVDSPVLLDVFDQEIGSELVASTNATESQNPGVLGGYFSSSGVLSTARGRSRKRYVFNENGYLMDVVYILPRLYRTSFLPDFYPVTADGSSYVFMQGNFIPDFNGIGWQQPSFVANFRTVSGDYAQSARPLGFCCEPSWQQYRTLPDVCHGALNPVRGQVNYTDAFSPVSPSLELNSPLFTFNDRPNGFTYYRVNANVPRFLLSQFYYSDFNELNRVFGSDKLTYDNIFVVFRYAHQAKRQVTKRFTLNFN